MSSRRQQKLDARARRLAREAELTARARRKRQRIGAAAAALIAAVVVGAVVIAQTGGSSAVSPSGVPARDLQPLSALGRLTAPGPPGPLGPEGVPIPRGPDLARSSGGASSSPVDGIRCLGGEQLLFHIHSHLTAFVNGAERRISYGVGIVGAQVSSTPAGTFVGGGACFYWLHTHAADGIIHVESPIARTFTLGNFFDVWRQRLGPDQLGPNAGRVTALVNGRVFRGNPRDIPLTAHAQIQLEVGRPLVAPVSIAFPNGL